MGLLTGAATVMFAAGVLGAMTHALLPAAVRWAVAAVLGAAVVAREFGLVSFAIPENRRLVPESVTNRGADLGALQFGFEMGTGMRTYSPSALPHLVLGLAVLVIPFGGTMAAGVGFALGRWAMAIASVEYDEAGTWSEMWARHRRPLAAVLTVSAVLGLFTGLL